MLADGGLRDCHGGAKRLVGSGGRASRERSPGLLPAATTFSLPTWNLKMAQGGIWPPRAWECSDLLSPVWTFPLSFPVSGRPQPPEPCATMWSSKVGRNPVEFMRHQMHQLVDIFCDRTQHQSQGAQDGFNKIMLEAVDLHHDQNDDEESSPLLPEVQQELRSRVLRSSVLDLEEKEHPEVQKTEESFCDRALRLFRRLLYQLQLKWQAALAWVREKVAAGLQAFCDAVEAVWSAFNSFCTSVAQVFRSAVQA
ncbi:interleukin-32 isoform X2 [Panthera pardus]|uniref:Interleukin-32 isoform X2 n=1 Tax=Panthera pardus TaxID=9691 RepID=A0A9V1GJU7_PANPR|nr:interleukin-32 isoform X2 [Panthera pardus]